jgi:hypothetical protein
MSPLLSSHSPTERSYASFDINSISAVDLLRHEWLRPALQAIDSGLPLSLPSLLPQSSSSSTTTTSTTASSASTSTSASTVSSGGPAALASAADVVAPLAPPVMSSSNSITRRSTTPARSVTTPTHSHATSISSGGNVAALPSTLPYLLSQHSVGRTASSSVSSSVSPLLPSSPSTSTSSAASLTTGGGGGPMRSTDLKQSTSSTSLRPPTSGSSSATSTLPSHQHAIDDDIIPEWQPDEAKATVVATVAHTATSAVKSFQTIPFITPPFSLLFPTIHMSA